MEDDENYDGSLDNCPWCGSDNVENVTEDDYGDYNEDDQAIMTEAMFHCKNCGNLFMEIRKYGTIVISQGFFDEGSDDQNYTVFYGVTPFEYEYHKQAHPEKCKTPSMLRARRDSGLEPSKRSGVGGYSSALDGLPDANYSNALDGLEDLSFKGALDGLRDLDRKPRLKVKRGPLISVRKIKLPQSSHKNSKKFLRN